MKGNPLRPPEIIMGDENIFSGLKVVDLSSFIAGPSAAEGASAPTSFSGIYRIPSWSSTRIPGPVEEAARVFVSDPEIRLSETKKTIIMVLLTTSNC
jgi:hypothetical protein